MENVFIILPNQLFKDIVLNRFYIESDEILKIANMYMNMYMKKKY